MEDPNLEEVHDVVASQTYGQGAVVADWAPNVKYLVVGLQIKEEDST